MFHRATDLVFKDGTVLELKFQDGQVKQYDMESLFGKYPQLTALRDRRLFLSGRLLGQFGIVWNDELDLEAETVYQDGVTVRIDKPAVFSAIGEAVMTARARKGLSQKELSEITGIDQADISRIERGIANPSVSTLNRIAEALDARLTVSME
jgi:Predicted transcription factor, homolog of eukaryotic MBF1